MQKLHEQNAQEIANNQILKLATENKLLESKLVLAETLREDANINKKQALDKLEASLINVSYERLKADTHEKRADFNGKVAGCLMAVNVALAVSVVMLLLP